MSTLIWKDEPVDTIGSLVTALGKIVESGDETEAADFLAAYRLSDPEVADTNVGYCLGYLSHDDMVKGLRMFKVNHPVFGGAPEAEAITTEKAFELGQEWGQRIKDERG